MLLHHCIHGILCCAPVGRVDGPVSITCCWLQSHCVDWSVYVVLPCGGLMTMCSSHDWIWYHMHVSDEVAFHSKWHCMYMSWWLICMCVLLRILWCCCCCPISILSFISFIMNCEYSPCLLNVPPTWATRRWSLLSFLVRGVVAWSYLFLFRLFRRCLALIM